MGMLKLNIAKIIVTIIVFFTFLVFFLPIKVNAICAIGQQCPQLNSFGRITQIKSTPTFIGINWIFVFIELVIAYILSVLIVEGYRKISL